MFQWGGLMTHTKLSTYQDNVDLKSAFAEFWGLTFLVIFGGSSAITTGYLNTLAVAFTFGIMYMILSYALWFHSGAHLNPSITFALCLGGKITFSQAVFNWIGQFCGATFGALVLWGE